MLIDCSTRMAPVPKSLPTASLIDWSIDHQAVLWIIITISNILLVDSKGFTERIGATDQDIDGTNDLNDNLPQGDLTESNDGNLQQ